MPSFDIVSKTDLAEVDNAVDRRGARDRPRASTSRVSKCSIERKEAELTILADDDLKLKQMHELLKGHLARRKLEPGALDSARRRRRPATRVRQEILVKQGIDATSPSRSSRRSRTAR